ncbi:hypothetical protein CSUI_010149 [Cystoisospora suis]|uniref:Transmembrane protein n=1 Tax=Cystoisospora suis TaxID=483139 RepID=A0A2C6KES3_9APIC|nr:hypothetical protein CSUI_010149 [Cystoisospora suis]
MIDTGVCTHVFLPITGVGARLLPCFDPLINHLFLLFLSFKFSLIPILSRYNYSNNDNAAFFSVECICPSFVFVCIFVYMYLYVYICI